VSCVRPLPERGPSEHLWIRLLGPCQRHRTDLIHRRPETAPGTDGNLRRLITTRRLWRLTCRLSGDSGQWMTDATSSTCPLIPIVVTVRQRIHAKQSTCNQLHPWRSNCQMFSWRCRLPSPRSSEHGSGCYVDHLLGLGCISLAGWKWRMMVRVYLFACFGAGRQGNAIQVTQGLDVPCRRDTRLPLSCTDSTGKST
jgi:hypothetical protein